MCDRRTADDAGVELFLGPGRSMSVDSPRRVPRSSQQDIGGRPEGRADGVVSITFGADQAPYSRRAVYRSEPALSTRLLSYRAAAASMGIPDAAVC
jgi:hypothetical protein